MRRLNLKDISKIEKEYLIALGQELVAKFGKASFYSYLAITNAHFKITSVKEIPWLGLCMYASYEDFMEVYLRHYPDQPVSEVKDEYLKVMEVLMDIILDPRLSDLIEFKMDLIQDASWLEFGEVFAGIGEGVVSIFEGIIEAISLGISG